MSVFWLLFGFWYAKMHIKNDFFKFFVWRQILQQWRHCKQSQVFMIDTIFVPNKLAQRECINFNLMTLLLYFMRSAFVSVLACVSWMCISLKFDFHLFVYLQHAFVNQFWHYRMPLGMVEHKILEEIWPKPKKNRIIHRNKRIKSSCAFHSLRNILNTWSQNILPFLVSIIFDCLKLIWLHHIGDTKRNSTYCTISFTFVQFYCVQRRLNIERKLCDIWVGVEYTCIAW